jgi:hypothetical protein
MSDVIIIDDEPAPARVRKPRRAAAKPIVIDISDEELLEEAYTPPPKKVHCIACTVCKSLYACFCMP